MCLSGFRQATSVMCHGKRNKTFHEFSPNFKPNLLWLAPEVLQQVKNVFLFVFEATVFFFFDQNLSGYGTKSDIYSIGISACEMANGFPPFSDMAHMQVGFDDVTKVRLKTIILDWQKAGFYIGSHQCHHIGKS